MKKILPLLLLPVVSFAEFGATDSANLADIKSGLLADSGSGSFVSQGLTSFIFLNQRVSSWGGNFIKTVGDAAHKFVSEFGSAGWFTAVKASIGVIQADVGRINTALTDVNDHLEIIEGDVSSIKDTTESINTSVESIDSSVSVVKSSVSSVENLTSNIDTNLSTYLGRFSEFTQFFTNSYRVPPSQYINYTVVPNPNSVGAIDKTPSFTRVIHSPASYNNFFDALLQEIQLSVSSGAYNNGILANTLLKAHGLYVTSLASTNLLQKILDTNDVWYAKIYDRIPTNLTVVVSNIASNASNDWRYTASTALSSAPVLYDLTPSRDRDINQSFALAPPQLTGDFKADVILLLGNMQQIASSSASVDLDILTNVQVVAGSILSASSAVGQKIDEERRNAESIAQDGQSHEHDLDSAEQYFKIKDSNNDVAINLQNASSLPSKLAPLVVSHVADNYSLDVPAFSVFGAGVTDSMQINMDISRFQGYFDNIRSCFALFWFVFAFLIVWKLFLMGIRMLGWISSLINPFSFNAGTQGHDLSSFYG